MRKSTLFALSLPLIFGCSEKKEDAQPLSSSSWIDNDVAKLSQRIEYVNEPINITGKSGKTDSIADSWTLVANVAPAFTPSGQQLSSTCIQIIGTKAYASWHWNGAPSDYSGLLEVFDMQTPNMPLIISSLWSTDIDFNHLYVEDSEFAPAQKRLWAIGSRDLSQSGHNSPAWMGEFTLTNQIFTMNTFEENDIPSFSGNTVIKYDNSLLLTSAKSNGALSSFDLSNDSLSILISNERMRHLAINGNKMVALQQDDANSILYSFDLPNPSFTSPPTLNVGPIIPNDGKNVVTIDNNRAIIATGRDGLKVFDLNTMSSSPIHVFDVTGGFTNGVSTDDDYIYVANGANGLYILDKVTYAVIGNYEYNGSANYVASSGDYIFIANGTGGLKILHKN